MKLGCYDWGSDTAARPELQCICQEQPRTPLEGAAFCF